MKLLIGNKNYSSWSLRPWLLMKQAGIDFVEEKLSFNQADFTAKVKRYSPVGRVPVLIDDGLIIWDSLAIVEHLAERFPEKRLWPEQRAARAEARSIVAEMHSGFTSIRSQLSMNCSLRVPTPLLLNTTRREVQRIIGMWTQARDRWASAGPFLFGAFSIADAFYAPVVSRFQSYSVELPDSAQRYCRTMLELPAFAAWLDAASRENDFVAHDEPYREAP